MNITSVTATSTKTFVKLTVEELIEALQACGHCIPSMDDFATLTTYQDEIQIQFNSEEIHDG